MNKIHEKRKGFATSPIYVYHACTTISVSHLYGLH